MTIFRSLLLGAVAALHTTGAQAASYLEPGATPTEPGHYKKLSYRYTFDVVRPGRSEILFGNILNSNTGTIVTDPVLAERIRDQIDPLRNSAGKTGRVTIEVSDVEEFVEMQQHGGPASILSKMEYMLIECKSGFLCDLPPNQAFFRKSLFRDYSEAYSDSFRFSETGFWVEQGDISWSLNNSSLGYDWDYFDHDLQRSTVTIDGISYQVVHDEDLASRARLRGDFGLADFEATQLHPTPVPLPASAILLIAALSGGALLSRRRPRRPI